MLIVKDLCLSFGTQPIFENLSFTMQERQKIGLIGANGTGKSTLLKVLANKQQVDSGTFSIENGKRIAYMPQEAVLISNRNIFDEAFSVFENIITIEQDIKKLEKIIESGIFDDTTLDRYSALQQEYQYLDVHKLTVRTQTVLRGLGFDDASWQKSVNSLSVGWKMRLVLAQLLLQDADLYLFDEPTNHLDIIAKDWFLSFLKSSQKGYLLVSHDRYFLDHACSIMLELDRGVGKMYYANYSTYLVQKADAQAKLEEAYTLQQKHIKKTQENIDRFKAKASKAGMARSMAKKLEKLDIIELDKTSSKISFSFPPVTRAGRIILSVDIVSKSFGEKKLFANASLHIERDQKIALVAANGVGKTTLLSIIMGKQQADTGTVTFGHNVTTAFFEQDQEQSLNPNKTILEEIEDSCKSSEARMRSRAILGTFLFTGETVHKRIKVLSGGEKNRVAMTKVLLSGANFLILDEPTNHLDLQSKEILLNALKQYQGTILLVSHDRDFLDALSTHIAELTPDGIHCFTGNYETYIYQKNLTTNKTQNEIVNQPSEQKSLSKQSEPIKKKSHTILPYEIRKQVDGIERKIAKLEKEHSTATISFSLLTWGSAAYKETEERLKQINQQINELQQSWELLIQNHEQK